MDDDGDVFSVEETVHVANVLPDCSLEVDKDTVYEDEHVLATATCTDTPSDANLSLEWKIGSDTYKGDELNISFADSGEVKIELTAEDDDGGKFAGSVIVRVRNLEPEILDVIFPATVNVSETASFEVVASDTVSDKPELTYTWEFEDGKKTKGAKVDHVFTKSGTQQVKVTVEDDDGAKATKTVTVQVTGEPEKPPDDDVDNTLIYAGAGAVIVVIVLLLLFLIVIRPRMKGPEKEPPETSPPRSVEDPAPEPPPTEEGPATGPPEDKDGTSEE
jgi:PKD repeat protein